MRRLCTIFVLMVTLLAPGVALPTAAQEQDLNRDRANAATTASEILRLASEHKFNAMYDYIHPDAMAVVPRAAAIGAFTQAYEDTRAGLGQIVSVEIVPWIWGVTGKQYPSAAKVSFVQPYVNEA